MLGSLARLFQRLFSKNLDFFSTALSRSGGAKLLTWTFLTTIVGALYVSVNALLSSIAVSLPGALSVPMSWVVPNNAQSLLTAYVGFRIALALYNWQKTWIAGGAR